MLPDLHRVIALRVWLVCVHLEEYVNRYSRESGTGSARKYWLDHATATRNVHLGLSSVFGQQAGSKV